MSALHRIEGPSDNYRGGSLLLNTDGSAFFTQRRGCPSAICRGDRLPLDRGGSFFSTQRRDSLVCRNANLVCGDSSLVCGMARFARGF